MLQDCDSEEELSDLRMKKKLTSKDYSSKAHMLRPLRSSEIAFARVSHRFPLSRLFGEAPKGATLL